VRTEDDLRAALQSLERHAPDLATVLPSAASSGTALPDPGAPASHVRGPRPLVARRWVRAAVPLVAAIAVVAAVVTPLTVGNLLRHDLANGPGGSAAVNPAAAAALTAAAAAAAAQPAHSARYFRVSGYLGTLQASGPNAHPYMVDVREELSTTWYPSSAKEVTRSYANRAQVSALPTQGALSAWRAAGQPALPHRAAKESPYPDFGPGGDFGKPYFADKTLKVAQYLALPTNPAALDNAILAAIQDPPANTVSGTQPRPKPGSAAESQRVFVTCVALLERDPVTSAVRAATLDILATLPGLTFDEKVTDRLGRTGFGISMPAVTYIPSGIGWGQATLEGTDMKTTPRLRLVISPSGAVLDEEYVTTAPTLSSPRDMPPSGAIPGPAKCPAGWDAEDAGNHRNVCVMHGDVVHPSGGAFVISGAHGGSPRTKVPIYLDQPIVAVPAGTVLSYRAILGAGWTDDTPSVPASARSIPGS
jgi:hypothetical protein